MRYRWLESLKEAGVPSIDVKDLQSMEKGEENLEQFWPEFSQSAYKVAFSRQRLLTDYTVSKTKGAKAGQIPRRVREAAVDMIFDLVKKKRYSHDTAFVAVGLFDRYLFLHS